jgi:hypothetical protein
MSVVTTIPKEKAKGFVRTQIEDYEPGRAIALKYLWIMTASNRHEIQFGFARPCAEPMLGHLVPHSVRRSNRGLPRGRQTATGCGGCQLTSCWFPTSRPVSLRSIPHGKAC